MPQTLTEGLDGEEGDCTHSEMHAFLHVSEGRNDHFCP